MRVFQTQNRSGFVLVIVLISIVLLTIMAVAFLASSSLDQATARAYSNKANAELAARTAVNTAIARLTDNLTTYSDSATAWDRVPQTGNAQYQGTTLYYRQQSPDATGGGTPPPMYALPLISGAKAVPVPPGNRDGALAGALPATLDNTNSFDLNHARSANDLQGTIGAPTGAIARPEFRGQWIDQTDSDNKVTSRYAYWMEDESFKANVNQMGVTPRGDSTLGDSPSQIPLQGLFKALGLQNFDGVANAIFTSRSSFPNREFYEYGAIDQASPTKIADNAKFESTIFSGTSNLSRTGAKRINLDKVVSDSTDPTAIRSQLDQIIKAISYQAPNFAQRFYRLGGDKNSLDVPDSGTPSDRTIYLNKIAANIRDYIDKDSQPTIVNNDSGLTINVGAPPEHSLPGGGASGPNEVIAIGKEAVPFLQEYMLRVKLLSFGPRIGPSASFTIEIDHYLEFWNMGTKDIAEASLGPHPFIRIANQFDWDAGSGSGVPPGRSRDFSVPLAGFANSNGDPLVFAAGQATVLTTDPTPLPSTSFSGVTVGRIFRPPAGAIPIGFRVYSGTTTKKSGSELRLNSIPRPNQSPYAADLETELILGNDYGVLDSFGSPAAYYMTVNIDNPNGSQHLYTSTGSWYFRGSSLKGNKFSPTASEVGDPRTTNEQLSVTTSVATEDQTAFKNELTNSSVPGTTTLTGLDSNYVDMSVWTDPAMSTADPAHAPMVIANGTLTSIGQLGDIFDPSRLVGAGGIRLSRGGGRTLKIGQPDDLWDNNSNSASREWTSWRLADIFSTSDLVQLDGRINVNGIDRDGGAAFKCALYGYIFQPTPLSGPQVAGTTLSDAAIQAVTDQLKARLTNDGTSYSQFASTAGPLFEKGEVSELPIFNKGTDLTGVDMTTAYDRGREELFRRIADLITTRGNIFTVHAVGQSLIPPPAGSTNPPTVTATSQIKVTFRLDPHWAAGPPSDPFDPTQTSRFAKPDSYAIKILYVGD